MRTLTYLILILVFHIVSGKSFGQTTTLSRELTVGDTVPDLIFDTIINSNKTSVKLSDYKGKLVILDLWTTSCGSCIADFPRKQKVQEEFKNDVVILPVTFFKGVLADSIILKWKQFDLPKFWNTNIITKSLSIPTAIDAQSSIVNNFPVFGPGLQIWIDKNGILRGLTADEYVNSVEIKKILNNEKVEWAIKKRINFDGNKPLVNLSHPELSYSKMQYSAYFPHIPYVDNIVNYKNDKEQGVKKFTAINSTLLSLLLSAIEKWNRITPYENRLIIDVKDSSRFFKNDYYENWWAKYSYCYEKIAPIDLPDSIFAAEMIQDFQKYFGVFANIKYVKRKCKLLRSVRFNLTKDEENKIKMKSSYSYSINELLNDLNSNSNAFPFLLDSRVKQSFKRDVYMNAVNWNNWRQIDEVLKQNFLVLEDVVMEIPMIIISEKKY